jgi:energy-coupling factor transport system ATP-binding protein
MQVVMEHVSYQYPGSRSPTLVDLSFTIEPGEWLCLLGRTGSGKTTLIQHLNGLLRPTQGRVLINGQDPSQSKGGWAKWRRQIGLVFQYPEHQLFAERVDKEVAFALEAQNIVPRSGYDERVNLSLAAVGLEPSVYRDRHPFHLSGGEKRRVAIASTLVYEPSLLILDEPTAGLDPGQRHELLQLLARWQEERGTTIVCVTHDIGEFASFAQRALVLDKGRLVYDGGLTALLASPDPLFSAGLCLPSLAHVVYELGKRGWSLDVERMDLGEIRESILKEWKTRSLEGMPR